MSGKFPHTISELEVGDTFIPAGSSDSEEFNVVRITRVGENYWVYHSSANGLLYEGEEPIRITHRAADGT